ncbi:glycosyltransferase [Nocardioides marmoraquaticus]
MTDGFCPSHAAVPAPGDAARVSVVVTHYEQPQELARTLAALARQDRPPDEVVVTDDGSAEPPSVPPGVRLVVQPDEGFRAARARNRGVAATTGDVVVLLDADTAPEPSLLRHLTEVPRAEPDVLVVGRRRHTAFDDGPLDPDDPLRGAERHALAEPAWLADGWAASDDLRSADEGSFRFVISAVLAASRGWFDRVGGFDERFVGYGGEDWDLAHRWWTAGGRLRHVPGAVAWHQGDAVGGEERRSDPRDERRTAESVATAAHVNAPPVAFRGLRAAPARVVVTHDPDLDDRALVVAVDGLLRDLPQADVVSDRAVWQQVGDPRVRPHLGADAVRAAYRVHLAAGLAAEPAAWSRLLDEGTRGVTTLERPGVALTDLRRLRRAHLGLERATTSSADLPDGLRSAEAVSLQAWLGGWWR